MGENSNFSEAELSVFRSLFDSWDGNKNGVIEKEEIGDVLRAAGQDPTNAELDGFMERADTDKNGVVDFQEFVNMIDEVKKNTPKETLLQEAFKVIFANNFILFHSFASLRYNPCHENQLLLFCVISYLGFCRETDLCKFELKHFD